MAIKKQKRTLEEANAAPTQNGSDKKHLKQTKNIKKEKPTEPQNSVVPKKVQKVENVSVKPEGVKTVKPVKLEGKKKNTEAKLAVGEQPAKKVKKEGVPALAKTDNVTEPKKNKKVEKLLKKNENRKEARRVQGQFKSENANMTSEEAKQKIEQIESRGELTKSAKRRLSFLKRKLAMLEGTYVPKGPGGTAPNPLSKRSAKKKKAIEKKLALAAAGETSVNTTNVGKQKNKVAVKAEGKKSKAGVARPEKSAQGAKGKELKKLPVKKEEPEKSEDEDDEDSDAEVDDDSDEEMDDSNVGELDGSDEDDEEGEDDDDDEEDDDDEADDDLDETAKFALPTKKVKQEAEKKPVAKKAVAKNEEAANGDAGKKKRFVLFVGNLSFQATVDDIKNHFLTKVSSVLSVRLPTKPGSNSPRGIAYVELSNEEDYQKGLSLHNTNINGRRINVEYTQGGSKSVGNRSEIVSKNKKLHAMRKGGQLAGKRNNRNDRRQKAKQGAA